MDPREASSSSSPSASFSFGAGARKDGGLGTILHQARDQARDQGLALWNLVSGAASQVGGGAEECGGGMESEANKTVVWSVLPVGMLCVLVCAAGSRAVYV